MSLGSWWDNKPPPQKVLVRIGLLLSFMLLTAALLLDVSAGEHFVFPSLPDFVWDLAKLAIVGTAAVAVVDDLRGWGSAWRTLVAHQPTLCSATDEFVSATWSYLGLQAGGFVPSRNLTRAAENVDRCSEPLWALQRNNGNVTDATLVALNPEVWKSGRRAELPPVDELVIRDWGRLLAVLVESDFPSSSLSAELVIAPADIRLITDDGVVPGGASVPR